MKVVISEKKEETEMADKIRIPIFDGKEYECWKQRIMMILKLNKCQDVVTRERTEKEDEWDAKDLKAINVIYSGISNDQLQFIKDKETAYEIVKKFDELYLTESTALQICIRNKLEKLRLKDFEESSVFFTEFEKLVNELKSAGANVIQKEKLSYMIKMLPSSLNYVGDLIDVLKELDQTVEYVKKKIKMVEIKEKEEGRKNSASAFKMERKHDKTCFKCGKYGHFKAQCTSTRSNGNSWKPRNGALQQGDGRPTTTTLAATWRPRSWSRLESII
ncbi:Zinc knuckle [Popillia japonica]|uniref:Zinc knuckle n=1 Tax=Popillia japonica TaxID=7064 RepID=A0AAW1JIE3_POPJA